MKKTILFTCINFFFIFSTAQNLTDSLQNTGSTNIIPKSYPQDSIKIEKLISEVKTLQNANESNSNTIKAILSGREYDAQTKYLIIKNNLINAVETFQYLSTTTANLKSRNSTNSYELLIKDLNNPQSEALGFKFNETLLVLVDKYIQPKKNSSGKKIMDAIQGVTKSPILTSIPIITPALSISNSVVDLLRTLSVFDSKIDNKKINEFENALNNYIQYYAALSDANQGFKYNVERQKEELGILQQNTYEQVLYFAKTLNYPVQPKQSNEDTGEYLNNLFRGFNKTYVEQLFNDLEKANSVSSGNSRKVKYDELLKNQYLKDANNRLEEFIGLTTQFEFKYNDYFNVLEQYNSKILKALDIAKTNKIATPVLVDDKKLEFNDKKTESIKDTKISIDINQLKISKQKLNYTARII